MPLKPFPPRQQLTICFAHVAYQMAARFAARRTNIEHFQVHSFAEFEQRVPEADVVVVSMMWKNELVARAPRLRFIQSISAGTDQYDKQLLMANGIRLASAAGVNAGAVAEHVMALMLALQRHLHIGRDHQAAKYWRPMIADIISREDELGGKTLLIIGMGRIGSRLAQLAKAFNMTVLATRHDPAAGKGHADEVHGADRLLELLARSDIVAITCPLTPSTENLIDAKAFGVMKPTAHLINVARGKIVDEAALIAALGDKRVAAAALDVTREEPLPAVSALWSMENVLITPHTAGETRAYEDNVIDILLENLDRLCRGEKLRNGVV
jgi:phosphoglycerate dehydrogenase-like enzyme